MFRLLRPGFLRNSVDQLLVHENLSVDAADGYNQGRTNPGRQVARSTKFCTAAPNMCGSLVWNLLHVTFVAPRILRRLLEFWKSVGPWLLVERYNDYPARAAPLLSNEVAFPPHQYKAWELNKDDKSSGMMWCHFLLTYRNGCAPTTITQTPESETGIFATPQARSNGSAIMTRYSLIRWWQHPHTTWNIQTTITQCPRIICVTVICTSDVRLLPPWPG